MKRTIGMVFLVVWVLLAALSFTACGNQALFDTTWTFEECIIFLPDGSTVSGKLDKWSDFESSDMIQVTIDGKTYLTHSSNVVMISK